MILTGLTGNSPPATVAGTATITFPTVPATQQYNGSVSVPAAPGSATWVVVVSGQQIGSVAGSGQFGPFSMGPGQVLTLDGTGLTPDETYQGAFTGESGVPGKMPIVAPTNSSSVVQLPPGSTVEISGPVVVETSGTTLAISQTQELIASNESFVVNSGTTVSTNYPITAGAVNALAVTANAYNHFGTLLQVVGGTTGIVYWEGRPCVNDPVNPNFLGIPLRLLTPFPGDIEGSVTIKAVNQGSATQGFQHVNVIGFTGVVPEFSPPPVVAAQAAGMGPALLTAPTDGSSYRVWSLSVGCQQSAYVYANGISTDQLVSVDPGPNAYITDRADYPQGMIVSSLTVAAGGSSNPTATAVYDFV